MFIRKTIIGRAGGTFVDSSGHSAAFRCKKGMRILFKKFGNQLVIPLSDNNGVFFDSRYTCAEIGGDAVFFSIQKNDTDNAGKMHAQ